MLYKVGGIISAIAFVRDIAAFGQRFYGEWLTFRVAYDLRNHFYSSVQHFPFSFHDRSHTEDMMIIRVVKAFAREPFELEKFDPDRPY